MYTTVGTYYSFQMTVCCPGWIGVAHDERDFTFDLKYNLPIAYELELFSKSQTTPLIIANEIR